MREAIQAEPDPRRRRTGGRLWCAKVAGLVLVTFGSWWLVDGGLGRWVIWVAGWAAQWQPREGEHRALAPLNAMGPADAPLQLVLACDLAEPDCRQRLKVLTVWQARHADNVRLVLLQRPSEQHRALAEALQAARQQTLLWSVLARLQDRPDVPGPTAVGEAVRALHGHPVRWQRDTAEAEVGLQVGSERTMAFALGLGNGAPLLVSGVPATAAELSSPTATTAALERAWTSLQQRIAHHRGNVGAAQLELLQQLPPATRQRYLAWVLHGERASSLGLPSNSSARQR